MVGTSGSKSARESLARLSYAWLMSRIRETRLLAEFREQDSYINSDYDSDSDLDEPTTGPSGSSTPVRNRSPPPLTNSLIGQAKSLVAASNTFKRPATLPQPRIRFVLNRMEKGVTYSDPRIEETFRIIREMGVDLVLGKHPRAEAVREYRYKEPVPARNILLDLSVLVALCCDSAHHPLPEDEYGLESRFRALCPSDAETSTSSTIKDGLDLTPHSNVTRDLRDQLNWEMQHSLIGELQSRISDSTTSSDKEGVKFWVTEEVKGRLPNIIDTIGGPQEKARAEALFGVGDHDFWEGSRWQGKAPDLGDMRLGILETDQDGSLDLSELDQALDSGQIPTFNQRLVRACHHLLQPPESGSITPPAPLHREKYRRSRNYKRPQAIFPTTRLPSQHTLNSFSAGAKRGWTVLTNNRGAVGKVIRDMGVKDGLPFDREMQEEGEGKVSIWVVNPSSLSEWRRLEVEESNRALLAQLGRETS